MKYDNKSKSSFEKIVRESMHASLSADQKAKTRAYLREYMAMRPLESLPMERTSLFSFTSASFFSFRPITTALCVLVLVLTTGTAYAAEYALPGDTLYPVKVGVTEEVRSAFALSTRAKAEWAIERTQRRLAEASQLAAENRLNDAARNTIETHLAAHVAVAHSQTEALEAADQAGVAEETETELSTVLLAHADVLDHIQMRISNTDVRTNVLSVLAHVRGAAGTETIALARAATPAPEAATTMMMAVHAPPELPEADVATDSAITASAPAQIDAAVVATADDAVKRKDAARAHIDAAEKALRDARGAVSEEIFKRAEAMLDEARMLYAEGEQTLAQGDTVEAQLLLTHSFTRALQAELFVSTRLRLTDTLIELGFGADAQPTPPANTPENTAEPLPHTSSTPNSNNDSLLHEESLLDELDTRLNLPI